LPSILMRDPLPILRTAFAVVSAKEIHRNVTSVGSAPKVPFATPFAAKGFDKKDL
ncbi:hypothetical protein Tco_1267791, partial [Tanacetum coccineum]